MFEEDQRQSASIDFVDLNVRAVLYHVVHKPAVIQLRQQHIVGSILEFKLKFPLRSATLPALFTLQIVPVGLIVHDVFIGGYSAFGVAFFRLTLRLVIDFVLSAT